MNPFRQAARWLFHQPYLLLVLTTLFWGGNAVAGKLAAGVIPPFTLTCIRWVGTALILFIVARPIIIRDWPAIRQNIRFLFFCGAVGFAIFNFLLYGALNFTSAINAAIEQSGMPMLIILGMYLVYGERITALQGVGVVLSILGVLLTATRGDLFAIMTLDMNIGDVMMLGAVLAYSIYSVALKRKPQLDWRVIMFGMASAAAVVSIPFALFEMASGRFMAFAPEAAMLLLYVVLFPSLMAQVFFFRGVELVGANRAGLFINLVPIFGALLAVLILDERLELYHLTGLGLVLCGIGLAEVSARRRRAAALGDA